MMASTARLSQMHGLAGTGMLWERQRRIARLALLPARADAADLARGSFSFVQISDSHIGFNKAGINTDVVATLKQAIARINALPQPPDFILHHGDLTHLAAAEEFDTLDQLLKSAKTQKYSSCPASTMSPATTANFISSASARIQKVTGGIASTITACISSASSTSWTSSKTASARSAGEHWNGSKRFEGSLLRDSHRRLRAHSVVGSLSAMGAGARMMVRRH